MFVNQNCDRDFNMIWPQTLQQAGPLSSNYIDFKLLMTSEVFEVGIWNVFLLVAWHSH